MDSYQAIRASDQDRERVVMTLREAYAAGRLDLTELRDRAGAALRARTLGDLRLLTADIPAWVIAAPADRDASARIALAAGRGPGRLTAPAVLVALAAAAGAAAACLSSALVPLMILFSCVLLAAACSAGKR
jgi:Domain of unknown function (DUF1707)